MRYHHLLVTAIIVISLSPVKTSAHFFPNISSIPSGLLPNSTNKSAWDAFQNFTGCRRGDKINGLSKIKQYFHYFGYIQQLPSNTTDDFDDSLESAIKTYQKNFNLEPTGQLDNQTVQKILQPRCGNADIVNGSTTMNAGKPVSYNISHLHTVGHYSYFPGTPRWPSNRRDLTYGFLPQNQLTDDTKQIFANAFAKWSQVIPMNFTQSDDYTTADITIGFYTGNHGDGEPFDGVLGTLAHSFSPPSGMFHLDGAENWVISGDVTTSTVSSAVDLESVAVHEIGHLLGLGHSSVEEAIMYPTISARTRKVELASDDVEGIQALYGSNPNYNGTDATLVQQRETSSGAYIVGSWWGLTALVAAAVLDILLY
ncbi:metalloendoproteinase 2-MMP-like [Mangifera indica]|uniref:metalloendoproteinase 2-MMP-like n=1 Tax=Mangifera indica TaxID=29780 RepID=UPI001CFC1A77|nr:metalloendoproteinase 2-MMP-like [Mangifera indica]